MLKTKMLVGFFVFLLLLNVVKIGGNTELERLPVLSELHKDEIARIEISDASQKIILSKEDGVWMMTAPEKGKADFARIRSLILNFRKPIPMDALIDTNNEQEYGLDSGNALVVEMWTQGMEPQASFVLGADTAQGSSFLRISGSDSIYRARVGGRRRYAFAPSDWLSQQVIPFDINDVTSISVQGNLGEPYQINKGSTSWEMAGFSAMDLDQERIGVSLKSLITLRIGERIQPIDFQPDFVIALGRGAEAAFQLQVGQINAGVALVQVSGETDLYRVASPALERFTKGGEYFLDRKLLSLQDRQLLDLIQFSSSTQKIILQQDLSNNFWKVLEPNNLDLDLREIFFMVNTLISLEYSSSVTQEMTLTEPSFSILLRSLSGETNQLDFYKQSESQWVLTSSAKKGIYGINPQEMEVIVKGFGQLNAIK